MVILSDQIMSGFLLFLIYRVYTITFVIKEEKKYSLGS